MNGVLSSQRPPDLEREIALDGLYVVPPFAEAHNHNVEPGDNIDAVLKRTLDAGIFYVKNPNNVPGARDALAGKINAPALIDAVFANGGLTASGGHPIPIADRGLKRTGSPVWQEGGFYHVIDTETDLAQKWGNILAGRPDFIKVMLLHSEEYARRKGDAAFFGWKGLDPALVPRIAARAHAAGLRVSAHVETAADFRAALAAGVDEINHTPGFRPDRGDRRAYDGTRYRIAEEDAAQAARSKTVVVTTLVAAISRIAAPQPGEHADEARTAITHNLRLLREHGVHIAIGSDSYEQTARDEALALASLNLFDNLSLLKIWCEATPVAIFPGRKIGALREGFEASFVALKGYPLQDFSQIAHIAARVKQGVALSP